VATATLQAVEKVGMPEAAINLAQAVIYLSMSLKSNAVYKAIKKAMEDVESSVELPVPDHLKSSFKNGGYKYPHDYPRHWVEQDYLVERRKYCESSGIGFEKQLEEWLRCMKEES
jgi:putative ATPase